MNEDLKVWLEFLKDVEPIKQNKNAIKLKIALKNSGLYTKNGEYENLFLGSFNGDFNCTENDIKNAQNYKKNTQDCKLNTKNDKRDNQNCKQKNANYKPQKTNSYFSNYINGYLKNNRDAQNSLPRSEPTLFSASIKAKKENNKENLQITHSLTKREIDKIKIEAVIDLHSLTLEQAYNALDNFLRENYIQQNRNLLVITGGNNLRVTTIRKNFPQWLQGAFSKIVYSFAAANIKHGGQGAFYVILRNVNKQGEQ